RGRVCRVSLIRANEASFSCLTVSLDHLLWVSFMVYIMFSCSRLGSYVSTASFGRRIRFRRLRFHGASFPQGTFPFDCVHMLRWVYVFARSRYHFAVFQ
ncbi:hypothetical protein M514_17323, partial [Trichuris suis]